MLPVLSVSPDPTMGDEQRALCLWLQHSICCPLGTWQSTRRGQEAQHEAIIPPYPLTLPGCCATIPVGRTGGQLWALWLPQNRCLQHQQALEDAPQLRIQHCPSLPALSWPGQLQDTELAATGTQHLHLGVLAHLCGASISSPPPAFCVDFLQKFPAEILHLCVFPGAWRHLNRHKTTTWRGFTSPLSCPVHEGP